MINEIKFPVDKSVFIAAWNYYTRSESGLGLEFMSVITDLLNEAYRCGFEDGKRAA